MHIRNSLSNLLTYMDDINSNILKFNTYLKGLIHSSHKCRECLPNRLINITKVYFACKNKQFKHCISTLVKRDKKDPLSY